MIMQLLPNGPRERRRAEISKFEDETAVVENESLNKSKPFQEAVRHGVFCVVIRCSRSVFRERPKDTTQCARAVISDMLHLNERAVF